MNRGLAWMSLLCSVACVPSAPAEDTDTDTDTDPDTGSGSSTDLATSAPVMTDSTTVPLDTTATEGDADTSTTTGPPPMCDDADGTYSESCPDDAPFCVGSTCLPCSDQDPLVTCDTAAGAPGAICSGGACVQCNEMDASACGGTTPICDMATNTCAACSAHDQCPGGAGCHLFEGSCLPSESVFMVNAIAPMCDMPGQPYCTISSAITAAGPGNDATVQVAASIYVENVVITSGAAVAIIGMGDVSILGIGGSPGVTVNVDGTGYLAGVVVENNSAAPGVRTSGDLRMDDSTIRDADVGLLVMDGQVHLERVRVLNNALAGVSLGGADVTTLRNVIIAGNGSGATPRGLVTTAESPFSLVYTTIADNAGANGGAISCVGEAARSVRNSILVSTNFSNVVSCGKSLTVTGSVIADSDYESEATNVLVMDETPLAFDGNYEIGSGSVAEGVAVWLNGDPLIDINGVMRPGVDGMPDSAGANVPN